MHELLADGLLVDFRPVFRLVRFKRLDASGAAETHFAVAVDADHWLTHRAELATDRAGIERVGVRWPISDPGSCGRLTLPLLST